jgi:hypothetical protein
MQYVRNYLALVSAVSRHAEFEKAKKRRSIERKRRRRRKNR